MSSLPPLGRSTLVAGKLEFYIKEDKKRSLGMTAVYRRESDSDDKDRAEYLSGLSKEF